MNKSEQIIFKLSEMKSGNIGVVKSIQGERTIKLRLMNMGLVKGEKISIKRISPFGGPIELSIKGYNLSLRREEAEHIYVEVKS